MNFSASYAPALENILTFHDKEFLSNYLLELRKNPEINYIAVYDEQNNILEKQIDEKFSDEFSHAYEDRKNERPQKADLKEIGHPHGFFHKQGHNYDVLVPLFKNQEYIGKIQIGIDTSNINQRVAKKSTRDIFILLGIILSLSVVIMLIDRNLQKILSRFIATTKKMHEGDMTEKIDIKTGDALETLGNSFNLMAAAVKEREDIIKNTKTI